jgi:hypothetical protein
MDHLATVRGPGPAGWAGWLGRLAGPAGWAGPAAGISITDVPELSLAEVQDELYSLTPAEFIAVRDERSRQARAAGQRDLASAIKKLARPTASAWLVNQLARDLPGPMGHLFEVGEELLEAQRTLSGDRMRELSADRRRAIADLLPEASRLAARARQTASATVLGEVRATLEAAIADPAARDAVRSGRLTKALVYAGLGEVDLTAALAAVPEPGRAKAARASGRPGTRAAQPADGVMRRAGADSGGAERTVPSAERTVPGAEPEVATAEQVVATAEREANAATAALEKAERQATSLEEQRQFLRRRLDHLERELEQARAEDAQLERQAREARERAKNARASAEAAAKALESARNHGKKSSTARKTR